MADEVTMAPAGSGESPVRGVHLRSRDLAVSSAFYAGVFGWRIGEIAEGEVAAVAPAGPSIVLRLVGVEDSQGSVVVLGVRDVEATLRRVEEAGCPVEGDVQRGPASGSVAYFRDPWGTRYGLVADTSSAASPRLPVPFGDNPTPPSGSICSLELHSGDLGGAAQLFGDVFGWGTRETMPQYLGFDPGAGVAGVFQSHTPATPVMAYVYVPDVAATLVAIESAGGKRLGDPMAMSGMTTFGYFTDPAGTSVGVMGG